MCGFKNKFKISIVFTEKMYGTSIRNVRRLHPEARVSQSQMVSLAQVVPGPVQPYRTESWHTTSFILISVTDWDRVTYKC